MDSPLWATSRSHTSCGEKYRTERQRLRIRQDEQGGEPKLFRQLLFDLISSHPGTPNVLLIRPEKRKFKKKNSL